MPNSDLSDPITLRLPVEVLRDIEAVAIACDRSRSWVMVRALRQYLADEGADILAFMQGRKEFEEGKSFDLETVLAEVDAIVKGKAA